MINQAKTLFTQYQNEIAGISPDLKDEVQASKKAEIKEAYLEPIAKAKADLENRADEFEADLALATNRETQLAQNAMNDSGSVDPGTLALISSLPGLPQHMLNTMAARAKSPALQLALYAQAENLEPGDQAAFKQSVLDSVPLPMVRIQTAAKGAFDCLSALFEATTTLGGTATRKLDLAHRMEAVKAHLT